MMNALIFKVSLILPWFCDIVKSGHYFPDKRGCLAGGWLCCGRGMFGYKRCDYDYDPEYEDGL